MTPRELGYRMPAEWEPHAATWLSWPHNRESWPGRFEAIEPVYAQMVAALASSEPVHINVNDAASERRARAHLADAGAIGEIHFHHFPTNDAWCRDHGAVFVTRDDPDGPNRRAGIDWRFNAWGGKYPYELDDAVAAQMTAELGDELFVSQMVLEGGSIDLNGKGLLLTTESCLLHPNRNPAMTREQIEQQLQDLLGVDQILWLGDGIAGDDTDGHIDDLARFVAEDVIITTIESDPNDANFVPLRENRARLDRIADQLDRPLTIVELPMPPAIVYDGQCCPATYANFYIANRVVLVPGYDERTDQIALETLRPLFPGRDVITIDCTDLIWGLGAFHCLTQQVPAV